METEVERNSEGQLPSVRGSRMRADRLCTRFTRRNGVLNPEPKVQSRWRARERTLLAQSVSQVSGKKTAST